MSVFVGLGRLLRGGLQLVQPPSLQRDAHRLLELPVSVTPACAPTLVSTRRVRDEVGVQTQPHLTLLLARNRFELREAKAWMTGTMDRACQQHSAGEHGSLLSYVKRIRSAFAASVRHMHSNAQRR